MASARRGNASPLDQRHLLDLVGYNCRRAYVQIHGVFLERMARFKLRPAEYSVLAILLANPDVTQKRLGATLNISPPNLAVMLDKLQQRGLVLRVRNPADGRSQLLQLTDEGLEIARKAERVVAQLELDATAALDDDERQTLIRLLQKVFVPPGD